MSTLQILGLGLFTVAYAVAAMLAGRHRGESGTWAWSWAALLASGALFRLSGDEMGATAFLLATLFPVLQLAGAYEHVDRPVPRWLFAAGFGIGLLRSGMAVTEYAPLGHAVALPFELVALGMAAVLVSRALLRNERAQVGWLLVVGFVLIGVAESIDAISDWRGGPGVSWLLWLGVGLPVGSFQVLSALYRLRLDLQATLEARETAVRALEENTRRFDAIAAGASDLVAETDLEGRIFYASPSFRDVLGYEPERLVGTAGLGLVHRDDLPAIARAEAMFRERGSMSHPALRFRHRDGSWRWVEGTAHTFQTEDGAARVLTVNRDVTERIQLEERLRQTQKLESLGLLAGGIAHDFNNMLVPILGNAGLLREQLPAGSEWARMAEELQQGAERAAELTQQLLAYAGRRQRELTLLDLSTLVEETAKLCEKSLPPGVSLERRLAGKLPPLRGDAGQIGQVVLNLVTNAADAMAAGGGLIEIETGVTTPGREASPWSFEPHAPSGACVYVEVSDRGSGLPEDLRARVFDPFFTTKEHGRGLGLAVVLGILKSHEGCIGIRARDHGGSALRALFPALDVAREAPLAALPRAPLRATGTVLVVDDDDGVRGVAIRALRGAGFRTLEAENGAHALELARAEAGIACVLLDVTMPGQHGEEVYRQLAATHPALPVLFSSGFANRDLVERLPSGEGVGFLQKPYPAHELVAAVADLIGTAAAER